LIYGGRNDSLFKASGGKDISLNDYVLFNIKAMQWESIEQYGFRPDGRWNASISYDQNDDKLFIFGGSNLKGYFRNDIYSFEMKSERMDILF
jgi:hypothetical protein